jgi:hypothetical protein
VSVLQCAKRFVCIKVLNKEQENDKLKEIKVHIRRILGENGKYRIEIPMM